MDSSGYIHLIAKELNSDKERLFLFWKGRVALYALLKAMGIEKGDEVILPAYTCVVVPNAILYLGAIPKYVDIDLKTYNADINKLKDIITSKTKVIICQNTFGLSSNIEQIIEIAKENNLYTIEDCTHGFGGTYKGKPNGSYCDASFYSTQWNKPFSTGIGGFALINNLSLCEPLTAVNKELQTPTFVDELSLKVLYFIRNKVLVSSTYWGLVKLYRFLSKYNLVLGSSSREEINGVTHPQGYFKSFSKVQEKEGIKNIQKLQEQLILRKKNAKSFTNYLIKMKKNCVPFSQFENHSFLKYPLLVKNRNYIIKLAERKKIQLGEWFCSPLHPILEGFEEWNLDAKLFPNSVFVGNHMINLPTDTRDVKRIIEFLDTINEYIINNEYSTSEAD